MKTSFERLAEDHPDTVYGRYAKIALALRPLELSRHPGGAIHEAALLVTIAQRLEEAIRPFPAGHPLRNRGLLELARLQRNPRVGGDAVQTVQLLLG